MATQETNADRLDRRRKLTEKQAAILAYATQAEPPTAEQIRQHFGFTTPSTVSNYIKTLIRKGALPRDFKTAKPTKTRNQSTK